jgi:exoribonuclease-2
MEAGCIVEFIDRQRIVCAVVQEAKSQRLRLLTEDNREVSLSANRLSHISKTHLNPSNGRDAAVAALKETASRRQRLIEEIDIRELWEVLNTEKEWIDLATMTAFCFSDPTNSDQEAAVMRAFFTNRLYFKFDHDRFMPRTETHVAKIKAEQVEQARRQALIQAGVAWVREVLSETSGASQATPPVEREALVEILKSYYLFEKESPQADIGRQIVKNAGMGEPAALFDVLVRIGVFTENENVDLLRYGIATDFSVQVLAYAQRLTIPGECAPDLKHRRDLTGLDLVTIDGQATLDFDDALSCEDRGDHYLVGVHIADVGHYVKRGDVIDNDALARASSIYMPDQKISMLPPLLAESLCSLRADEVRPALSTMIRISKKGEVLTFEIFASLVRVKHQLSYWDTNMNLEADPALSALYRVAQLFRQQRFDQEALQITLPELHVWIDEAGSVCANRVNRESPSRMLVAELMILANWLTARFLDDHQMPAVFRCQAEPRNRLYHGLEESLYLNWMQRRHLSRFMLSSKADRHVGLGLPLYTTATSPIRKYVDLVTQRQLRAVLGLEAPYSSEEIDRIIAMLQQPMAQVGRTQQRRQRYWLLKYLSGKVGEKTEAIVLGKRRNGYQVLLVDYLVECLLPMPESMSLNVEEVVQVTLQQANPRSDRLAIHLA